MLGVSGTGITVTLTEQKLNFLSLSYDNVFVYCIIHSANVDGGGIKVIALVFGFVNVAYYNCFLLLVVK